TLIGATTQAGMLSAPLRDRFGIVEHMNYYKTADLEDIVRRTADIFQIDIQESGAHEIALRSRGTPRVANRLLKRIRDFAQVSDKDEVDLEIVRYALKRLKVDELGLDSTDLKLLKTMIKYYAGGPVGLNTLAANIGEETDTIAEMYEPYLLQIGLIKRTARGRIVTKKGYDHLNYPLPGKDERN
ncbi:Holliday junction DNA helicase RuvB C-terminal domain-containing protein, partial [Lentilactobacillus parabuchneri]|uniref:Holliday junction DNA helicase RuvB C-terminal domain-containing protein n=1 Tax=Lentilactobacillus parabuchneri TaxID=152331 RepID=UPI0031F33185|nr:Holliday junction branch migration DNA helicase RuvB [Lentilactobacillus parabuchneri]